MSTFTLKSLDINKDLVNRTASDINLGYRKILATSMDTKDYYNKLTSLKTNNVNGQICYVLIDNCWKDFYYYLVNKNNKNKVYLDETSLLFSTQDSPLASHYMGSEAHEVYTNNKFVILSQKCYKYDLISNKVSVYT